jgi:anti-sigma regulatory factor (Ser/Thr protein kinase)
VAIVSRPHAADSLWIEVPATADRLVEIRRELSAWLEPIGLSAARAADIVLAVNEACTNSVEHAYRGVDSGALRVEASYVNEKIVIAVADSGVWHAPLDGPTTRGRGLLIMRAVSDQVDLMTSSSGTTVHITFNTD